MRLLTANQALVCSTVICAALLFVPFDFSFFKTKSLDFHEPVDYGSVIGIDLGLKYSRVGIVRNGEFEIISDEEGRSVIPSVVAFMGDGKHLVGFEAQEQALGNPKNTIYDIRHLIGRNFSDPATQKRTISLPYDVVEKGDNNGKLDIKIKTEEGHLFFAPEDITVMLLKQLRKMAETHLNTTVTSAVIAVPSYFNGFQMAATNRAAAMAGLNVLRMIDEPEAAALGHRLDLWEGCGDHDFYGNEECNLVVCDVQETESDLTILEVDRGLFEVMASVHSDLGSGLIRYLPSILQTQLKSLRVGSSATLVKSVEQLLEESKLRKQNIHGILVTGYAKLAVKAQKALEVYFGNLTAITNANFSNDESVVRGAARQGDALLERYPHDDGCTMTFDVLQLSLGIEASNGTFHTVIRNNVAIPTRRSIIASTTFENQEKVVIKIWEGQRAIANKNRLMGALELTGISPMPKGMPRIEASLEIDANRNFRAVARELQCENDNVAKFTVRARKSKYTQEIVRAIYDDAEKFREEDTLWLDDLSNIVSGEFEDSKGEFRILVR